MWCCFMTGCLVIMLNLVLLCLFNSIKITHILGPLHVKKNDRLIKGMLKYTFVGHFIFEALKTDNENLQRQDNFTKNIDLS